MTNLPQIPEELSEPERYELYEGPAYSFDLNRRQFVFTLGAGLLVTLGAGEGHAQRIGRGSGGGGGGSVTLGDRLHIGADGIITVLTSKVEIGQGSRTELSQAAAEELRVPLDRIRFVMADTSQGPNDGMTAGSRTTPSNVPAIRQGAATMREALIDLAAAKWQMDRRNLVARAGKIINTGGKESITYGELAGEAGMAEALKKPITSGVTLTPIAEWTVLGHPAVRVNAEGIVTGGHHYPSDMALPGMLYGAVLRPPAFGATLSSVDLTKAETIEGAKGVRDGDFAGCVAPTSAKALAAVEAIAATAVWMPASEPHPTNKTIYQYLKDKAASGEGAGRRGGRTAPTVSPAEAFAAADKKLEAAYEIAYIQHAPMEPRAALAQWEGDALTVWTGTQMPSRVQGELAGAFRIGSEKVRVIVPDTGGGFGGKHTGEVAVEAARLAKAAGKPVMLRWTREEEFTWAYFRPAGLIEIKGGLDAVGKITAWDFTNYNSGASAIATPYDIPNVLTQFRESATPLREGSYRALASTANVFARESFMDELASAAGADPLEFRMRHMKDDRLKGVLEAAAAKFQWGKKEKKPARAFGLACGTEKGSYAAACVEIEIDRAKGAVRVIEVVEAYECGKILNPLNLKLQVEGAIIMGLGGALSEEVLFEEGKVLNATFAEYHVPRYADVPAIETALLDRPDLPSVGAGETPIIAVAPAIGNAIFAGTGMRMRGLPLRVVRLRDAV